MKDYYNKTRKEQFECGELAYYAGEEIRGIIDEKAGITGFSFLEKLTERLTELAIPKEDNARGHSNLNPEVFKGLWRNVAENQKVYSRKIIEFKKQATVFLKRLKDIYRDNGVGGLNSNEEDLREMQNFCYKLSERLLRKEQQWFF